MIKAPKREGTLVFVKEVNRKWSGTSFFRICFEKTWSLTKGLKLILCSGFVMGVLSYSFVGHSQARDWTEGESLQSLSIGNPYGLSEDSFYEFKEQGLIHTLQYPLGTGVHFPHRPFVNMFSGESQSKVRRTVQKIIRKTTGAKSLLDVQTNMGLHPFPEKNDYDILSPYYLPKTFEPQRDKQLMGFSLKETPELSTFSVSCAQCHSGQLFGRTILGMNNRFARPNEFFVQAKKVFDNVPLAVFKLTSHFSKAEFKQLKKSKKQLQYVGAKIPVQLGLDTSLAQVSLSLALRKNDTYASLPARPNYRKHRQHPLNTKVADSKPMVWWNLKYKNRWLADGSLVSGNPILTNLLWNEIGRGTDLLELEAWIDENKEVITELTTAVFASKAPKLTDFIEPDYFSDLDRLRRGQGLYQQNCAKCHGIYVKNWDDPVLDESELELSFLVETKKVIYSEKTQPVNVGTSLLRNEGMKYLLPLNDLAISKKFNILIKPQTGYVPPPLVGIWSRWPYMHNNSISSLCELLTVGADRAKSYLSVAASDIDRDFDLECNGYPVVEGPLDKKSLYVFVGDEKRGLSNQGHDRRILTDKNGVEKFSGQDKKDLIYFLQTL